MCPIVNQPNFALLFCSYVDPVDQVVLRVNPFKLLPSYNATIDFDARDRALDVLVPLLELDSPKMAIRLGRKSYTGSDGDQNIRIGLYDALYPILTSNIGRSDASVLAAQLLRELARAGEENKEGLLYMQGRLVELASRDARVSQLVWNDLYPIPTEDEEDNNDDDVAALSGNHDGRSNNFAEN
jgi:hypothetical protein